MYKQAKTAYRPFAGLVVHANGTITYDDSKQVVLPHGGENTVAAQEDASWDMHNSK